MKKIEKKNRKKEKKKRKCELIMTVVELFVDTLWIG